MQHKLLTPLILIGFIMSCTQIPQTEPDWYNNRPSNDNMYYGVGVGEDKIQALVDALIDIQRQIKQDGWSDMTWSKSYSDTVVVVEKLEDRFNFLSSRLIHPKISLISEMDLFLSDTFEEDVRVFEENLRFSIYFVYDDMNGKVYEYNDYLIENYDSTQREFETSISKNSLNVTIEDIIDDLITFGYDYKHHFASDAHYVLLGINVDTIIDLKKGLSKDSNLTSEELEEFNRFKEEFYKRFDIE